VTHRDDLPPGDDDPDEDDDEEQSDPGGDSDVEPDPARNRVLAA
jgi:hypothetical protein